MATIKKTIAVVILWQSMILFMTIIMVSASPEVLDFFATYLQLLLLVTSILGLITAAALSIIYLIDE